MIQSRDCITYQGKSLTYVKAAEGGKNASGTGDKKTASLELVNGFYNDSAGRQYFVKKPKDKKEIFTEYFAGLVLKQFSEQGVLDAKVQPSLIYADVVKLVDGSYALIQPKMEFEEFYKHIYEGTERGRLKDRDATHDVFKGSEEYPAALAAIKHKNLAIMLVLSLILGDYSVHSGNVVLLKEAKSADSLSDSQTISSSSADGFESVDAVERSIARIDWGAAFRYYGGNDNANILTCAEYTGIIGIAKTITKNYLTYYTGVEGLFDQAMPAEGIKIRNTLGQEKALEKLTAILLKAINEVPHDLVDDSVRSELSSYLRMKTFAAACKRDSDTPSSQASKSANQQFAAELARIMYARIEAIAKLSKEKRLELELAALREYFQQREAEYKEQVAAEQAQLSARYSAAIAEKTAEIERAKIELEAEKRLKAAAEEKARRIELEKEAGEEKSQQRESEHRQKILELKAQGPTKDQAGSSELQQKIQEIPALQRQVQSLQAEQKATQNAACGACISMALFSCSMAAIVMVSLKGAAIVLSPLAILVITPVAITVAAITLPLSIYYSCKAGLFSRSHNTGSVGVGASPSPSPSSPSF